MPPESIKRTVDIRREIRRCPECAARFSRDAVFCPYDGTRLEAGAFDPMGDPLIGVVIDARYEIFEVLGEGGMGRVYRVRHGSLGREFALKALRKDLAADADLAERFIQEAKAAASLHHPNVVQISDFGQLPDGVPYFVMELLIGHTLGDVIKAGGPVPAARAVRIAKQIAAGLGAAHAAGVIHRDMKPENVFLVGGSSNESSDVGRSRAMLGERVDVRVVDFGAAKVAGSGRKTRAGIVFGTPHYMSPEQASGGPVDHRADIYALGIIMYEMFTGRVPFEADTYMGVLTQHMYVDPIPPSQVSGAARELGALEDVTLRCLQKRPEARYDSMDDLSSAIDAAAMLREGGDMQMASRSSRPAPRSWRTPMADALEPPTQDEARARRRRPNPRVVRNALAIGAVTLAMSALATALLRKGQGTAADTATPLAPASAPPISPPPPPAPATAPAPAPPADSTPPAAASAPRPPPRRPPPRRAPARDIDDVGDPFAASQGGATRK